MDSFVTLAGLVAIAALFVSLYSLRQVRRAPAMARQRELRDQLRGILEEYARQIEHIKGGIRRGQTDLPEPMGFTASIPQLSALEARLTRNHDGRIARVVVYINSVGVHLAAVAAARSRNATIESLADTTLNGAEAVPENLPAFNVEMALKDLDDACKEAAAVIAAEIKELNRLESQ